MVASIAGGMVNGKFQAADIRGVVQGTDGADFISGTGGNDKLQGNGGGDVYFGGAGSDAFVIKANDLIHGPSSVNNIPATDVIYDFSGAGGWQATNNDFIAFEHFGKGSTLNFQKYAGNDVHMQFYTIHDTTTNADYSIFIHSLNGKQLVLGDYNFY